MRSTTAQRDYNTYLKGMEKGLQEKLFFLGLVDFHQFDTIIDFGCGSGEVLRCISTYLDNLSITHIKLIGIDSDPYMRNITKNKVPNLFAVYDKLDRVLINERTLIVFNSVLHEVEDYWTELKELLKSSKSTVVVRDMRFNSSKNLLDSSSLASLVDKKDLAKLIRKANHNQLADFIERYGMIYSRDLYHFLLKYAYVENWSLELLEDYFSFNWQELEDLGNIIYERNYLLAFKDEQVKKDFDIDLDLTTHCQLILKID